MENRSPIIALSGVTFRYPGGPDVLSGVDFSVYPGERIGLLGPNGSGKTTLFHVIMGLETPRAGTVSIFGKTLSRPADFADVYRKVGLLFQDADDQLFCPTVLEDVAFGPLNMGMDRDEAEATARRTLDRLGLSGFEDRITHRLSGGEKRMISLATVLAMSPSVLLLDEPTTGLDTRTRARLTEVLNEIGIAYVLISHEMEFLFEMTDTVYVIENGRIQANGTARLHQHVHAHPHGSHPHEHR